MSGLGQVQVHWVHEKCQAVSSKLSAYFEVEYIVCIEVLARAPHKPRHLLLSLTGGTASAVRGPVGAVSASLQSTPVLTCFVLRRRSCTPFCRSTASGARCMESAAAFQAWAPCDTVRSGFDTGRDIEKAPASRSGAPVISCSAQEPGGGSS